MFSLGFLDLVLTVTRAAFVLASPLVLVLTFGFLLALVLLRHRGFFRIFLGGGIVCSFLGENRTWP